MGFWHQHLSVSVVQLSKHRSKLQSVVCIFGDMATELLGSIYSIYEV